MSKFESYVNESLELSNGGATLYNALIDSLSTETDFGAGLDADWLPELEVLGRDPAGDGWLLELSGGWSADLRDEFAGYFCGSYRAEVVATHPTGRRGWLQFVLVTAEFTDDRDTGS